jgi:cell wall-associated NlpC family hydrolase
MVSPKNIINILLAGCLLIGCGVARQTGNPAVSQNPRDLQSPDKEERTEGKSEFEQDSITAMSLSSKASTTESLLEQAYKEWKGTPYVLGGYSSNGVDCSRFVNIVFDHYFGRDLPTNTRTQLNVGNGIRRSAIQTGDLIFFRTGRKTLHVGIAMDEQEFLHASTSSGVTISKLNKKYWADRYLAARRIL